MRPFNLEEAKAGKPVCTRDGRNARIVCFDLKGGECPILAAVMFGDGEITIRYTNEGSWLTTEDSENDLFMKSEIKSGWVNLYKTGAGNIDPINLFDTEDEAKYYGSKSDNYLGCGQITWEE